MTENVPFSVSHDHSADRFEFSELQDPDSWLPLVRGHFVRVGEPVIFPHRCPGEGCAIQRWILERRND